MHLVALWVNSHLRRGVVPLHVLLRQCAAVPYRLEPLGQPVRLHGARCDGDLRDKCDGVEGCGAGLGAPHGLSKEGLHGGDGGVGVAHLNRSSAKVIAIIPWTHLGPGYDPRLDHHFGLGAEVFRLPKDQIRQCAHRDLSNDVAHALSYRTGEGFQLHAKQMRSNHARIDSIFRDISLDASVVYALGVSQGRQRSAELPHFAGSSPRSTNDLADAAHGLRVRADDGDRAIVVEDVFSCDRLCPDAGLGECEIFGDGFVKMVADHKHLESESQH
jgi:hypothetical protein